MIRESSAFLACAAVLDTESGEGLALRIVPRVGREETGLGRGSHCREPGLPASALPKEEALHSPAIPRLPPSCHLLGLWLSRSQH